MLLMEINYIIKQACTISINDCPSRMLYIILFSVFLLTTVIITGAFIYSHWYKKLEIKKSVVDINYSNTETIIY